MKCRKRLMPFVLALTLILGLATGASAATVENIKVQLRPDVTVKLNGNTQVMTDANGNPVYPIMNGGTTYLPVRAVSNMLGVGVDWDGATQTVLLDTGKTAAAGSNMTAKTDASAKVADITVQLRPDVTVKLDGKAQAMADANGNAVYPIMNGGTTYLPVRAVSNMLGIEVDWDGKTQTVLLTSTAMSDEEAQKTFEEFLKSLGITGITPNNPSGGNMSGNEPNTCNYAEIDSTTADDGYVKVKLTEQKADSVYCHISGGTQRIPSMEFELKLNKWVNIPLFNGSGEYQVIIDPRNKGDNGPVTVFSTFITANIKDPDAWTLLSSAMVDFENAPKTVAKAAELTKNCKTDAEKITAVFEFVAKNIKYDYKLITDEHSGKVSPHDRNLNPDHILDTKTGVCQHYAVLIAAMLRSQGIPCKVISGWAYSDKEWASHVWVSVSPDTKGLDMQRLGAGHDEDGWIRLDPTWASTGGTSGRAAAAIDKNYETRYAY